MMYFNSLYHVDLIAGNLNTPYTLRFGTLWTTGAFHSLHYTVLYAAKSFEINTHYIIKPHLRHHIAYY
jgi:hypothetical protein